MVAHSLGGLVVEQVYTPSVVCIQYWAPSADCHLGLQQRHQGFELPVLDQFYICYDFFGYSPPRI